jgi:hypothetical protein
MHDALPVAYYAPKIGRKVLSRGVPAGLEGVTGKKAVDSDAMTVKN